MRYLVCVVLLVFMPGFCPAQACYNKDIRNIFGVLKIDSSDWKRNGYYTVHREHKQQGIKMHIAVEDSVIVHAGFGLFTDSLLTGRDRWMYRFIERKLLLYAVCLDEAALARDLDINDVLLDCDRDGVALSFCGQNLLTTIVADTPSITVSSTNMVIKAIVRAKAGSVSLTFRRNGATMTGVNKIDAEIALMHALLWYTDDADSSRITISTGDTLMLNDSVRAVVDGTYMEHFQQKYFVVKQDGDYHTLYDEVYPVESFVTSVINPGKDSKNTSVLLTHVQYGGKKQVVLNLRNLILYLKRDHELYIGLEDAPGKMTGVLLAHNKALNYLHMLRFDTNAEMLFSGEPEYFCKLYAYIPTDNIKNLFGKYEKRKRNRIQVR